MKVNIYYGGRGIIGDPTIFVINKIQTVLEELNVSVERFNLYELKNSIVSLPASLNDCDAVILAATVEWYGIGGYLTQFLDACWLYGNKEKIQSTYMCPIVMSTASGEREAKTSLQTAWEILGGVSINGMCGYVSDMMSFEMNKDYSNLIEKQAENIYRTVSQKMVTLPSSNKAITKIADNPMTISLSPQETEQLSKYASDESYVQQQKEDISELASRFKDMLEAKSVDENLIYISDFTDHFEKAGATDGVFKFDVKERKKSLIVDVKGGSLNCYYGNVESVDVYCKLSSDIMNKIITGKETFQRAFMSGDMQVKGNFGLLRKLDEMFIF
ncbi:MAG: SCP2 sterol-binding domain-containing protein [Lachnospiraceae bacterium]|nr:SCP2 sterol-binding domain-containing protein [Lachnospiraceae bacterium]